MMSQIKFYKYTVWGLLGLNIGVLAFFLLSNPRPRPQALRQNSRSEIIEMLHLNDQQAVKLNELADEHKQKMKEISDRQAQLLSPYFESLVYSDESIEKDSILHVYQQSEREKIEETYQHFHEIKALLKEDQLPDFKKFMTRTTGRLLFGDKKR